MTYEWDNPLVWVLWGLLAAIAATGGVVVYRALVAYRARRSTPMLFLGAGLLMISLGMPALWMGAFLVTQNILWCSLLALAGIFVGFLLLLTSIQIREVRVPARSPQP